ncbi:hypothetical protein GQ600_15668 [Phytophthora cactorum]|nr:hypothetical protein GQ600_15668 [Phytophthora cactorum]
MLRQVPRRSLQLMRRVRHFSSSPDAHPRPQLLRRLIAVPQAGFGSEGPIEAIPGPHCLPSEQLDAPNYYLYAQLQLPSKTEIDAVEFLDGARFACDRILRAMHSPELIDFATANAPFRPASPSHKETRTGSAQSRVEGARLYRVYLSGVKVDRPTRAYLKTEEKLRAVALQAIAEQQHKLRQMSERPNITEMMSDLSSIKKKMESVEMEPEDGSETLERLQLRALFHTTQTVEAVSAMTSERVAVKSDVKTTLCFESFVTNPEDVDWQIVQMNQFGRVVS